MDNVGVGQVEKVKNHITATAIDMLYSSLGRLDVQIELRQVQLQQLSQDRRGLLQQIHAAEQEAAKKAEEEKKVTTDHIAANDTVDSSGAPKKESA